jgi:glycosyltransferase involved in cell wall biosynthesis
LRILILNWKDLSHAGAGGAEVFTEEVARRLVARDHSVTLFAAAVEGRPPRELIEGVDVVRAGGRVGVYRAARQFWSQQAPNTYDVVIDEINTRPFLTPRWIRETPIVALIHQLAREIWAYETPFPLSVLGRYVLEPWWLRTYRDVPAITVSASSAESLARYHAWRDVSVVPEGYTPHPVPDVRKEGEPTVVFLGRLVAMKRPLDAMEAFQVLARHAPTARLWVIGDGPLRPRLESKAPERVIFLGRTSSEEVRSRLARAHVLVATSVREGWGLNVSEAAACGTPSVGYRVPGLVDSLSASGGLAVDATPAALAEGLAGFFAGSVDLRPKISTVPWEKVAAAVEDRLLEVVAR